jgi:hypothetical protein
MNRALPALPTNHILRQKLDADANEARRVSLEDSIHGLQRLCRSDKFRAEPYINVADVLLWAQQALSAQEDAASATYSIARMRRVFLDASSKDPSVDIDEKALHERVNLRNTFRIEAYDIEGPRQHSQFYVDNHDTSTLDMALEVLRADGYAFAEVYRWDGLLWCWKTKVTL